MKITTFNINNIKRRLSNLLDWLRAAEPDVVCLQELKATDAEFPIAEIQRAGYEAVWRGQKSWNGVAILARHRQPVLTRTELPGDPCESPLRRVCRERHSHRLHLPAQRQSTARAKIQLQARLVQAADPPRRGAA
jgi:exonuclease III